MAASVEQLTRQVVALTTEVGTLANRLVFTEQEIVRRGTGAPAGNGKKGGGSGVFDQKKLYPKDLKESASFRSWASRFIAWLRMDSSEIAAMYETVAKTKVKAPMPSDPQQAAYARAIYAHLRSLTEGYKKAAKIIRVVNNENGLEAWRKLVRRFQPQNTEIHAQRLEDIVMWGHKNATTNVAEVPDLLD